MNKIRWKWGYLILGGALSWLIHLLVSYAIGEGACILDGTFFVFMGVSSTGWALLILSLICFVASASSVYLGIHQSKESFLGRFAIFTNLIFSLAILAQAFPIFILLRNC